MKVLIAMLTVVLLTGRSIFFDVQTMARLNLRKVDLSSIVRLDVQATQSNISIFAKTELNSESVYDPASLPRTTDLPGRQFASS